MIVQKMKKDMILLPGVLLVICCICSRTNARTIYNVTLNVQNIISGIELNIGDTIRVYCEPGQDNYNLYNLKLEDDFNNCMPEDTIVIGSCKNSPLVININKLAFEISDQVFYEEGRSYYYTAFNTMNGIYANNQPCVEGLKFSMNVVSPVTATSASSKTAMSSTVVLIEPSSSIVESLMSSFEVVMEGVQSVVTGSTAVEYISTNIIPQDTTTGSVRSTNNRGMHSESTTQFRPVLTRPPVREGVESSSNVAVYSGAAVGGFVFLIIILVVIIITIGCLVYWKRELSGETSFYVTKGSIEENGTLRPILLNSPTHSIPNEFETDIQLHNHSNGSTFGHPESPVHSSGYENTQRYDNQHNPNGNTENVYEVGKTSNGNVDDRINTSDCSNEDDSKYNTMKSVSSTEEESIKSSTSRDPLLSPMTGNKQTVFNFNLGTIEEGDSSKLHQSCNTDTPV